MNVSSQSFPLRATFQRFSTNARDAKKFRRFWSRSKIVLCIENMYLIENINMYLIEIGNILVLRMRNFWLLSDHHFSSMPIIPPTKTNLKSKLRHFK